jgi:hypothetical protein
MSAQLVIDAFKLTPQALVEQRIAKKLLVEQGAPTAGDKRLINDGVEELWWHGSLKPGTVGVPAFIASTSDASGPSADCDVIELALLSVLLRQGARDSQAQRLQQLIHRAIPYPVMLVAETSGGVVLSVAHKRPSLGEAGRWVVGDSGQSHAFDPSSPTAAEAAFLNSLALDKLPRSVLTNLSALYQGYADRITALEAAQITGQFAADADPGAAAARREALAERERMLAALAAARSTAAKERQINRRVELNLQIQQLKTQIQAAESRL